MCVVLLLMLMLMVVRCFGGVGMLAGLTIEFLEDTLHGAGAAAAAHGDVELVLVVGHNEGLVGGMREW